jgi:hypothetical protein
MGTALMMSHHGFRRDLACFAKVLQNHPEREPGPLRDEWQRFRTMLVRHHEGEDQGIFPDLGKHPSLGVVVAHLADDHRRIASMLERGDRAFVEPLDLAAAVAVISDLEALLDPHFAMEERDLIPFLRDEMSFPEPANDDELTVYAEGFAWATSGVHRQVLDALDAMLPASVKARMETARQAYDERATRVWGAPHHGATLDSSPDFSNRR